MFKNYFTVALRNIRRNKFYSFINISGLAVGMACSILILLWVWDELSFDQFNENKEDIYRIVSSWEKWEWDRIPISPGPLGPAIVESVPGVDDMFRILDYDRSVVRYKDKTFYENGGIIVDPSIFSVFTFPFLYGDPKFSLSTPESIVISEEMTEKYFGSENPVGKSIEVNGKLRSVTGVFRNIPKHSHLKFDFAVNFKFINEYSNYGTNWGSFNFTTYVLLNKNEGKNLTEISETFVRIAKEQKCPQVEAGVVFNLQPLNEIHLFQFGWQPNYLRVGDSSEVFIFTLVAIFILLIACVNFINLSTASSMKRAREVGLRKTIGAVRKQLIGQFIGESLLTSLIALIFSLVLIHFIVPDFNDLAGKSISIDYTDPIFISGLIVVFIFTGIIAGFYPAIFLSSFNPVKILKQGYHSGKSGKRFRNLLVVFQFALSIALIFITIVLYQQIHFSKNLKLGYNKDNLLHIPIIENLQSKYEIMKDELLNNALIKSVSAHKYNFISDPTPRAAGFKWEGMQENRERSLDLIWSGVDYKFFEMLDIDLSEGKTFSEEFSSDKDGVILNEAAIADMHLESPVGKWISLGEWKKTIIGVVSNVHFRSSRQEIEPRIYYLSDYPNSASGVMLIKIDGAKTQEAIKFIEEKWNGINSVSPFEFGFVDEEYSNLYKEETRLSTIFNSFAFMAIIISCLGLIGLASFLTERKAKEIGVRKVLGATVKGITFLLSKEFLLWVLLANVIAWPVAYYFMSNWLQDFAYRIDITLWPFLLSGLVALLIAVITVSYQSIRAAIANPVESLKYE